MHSLLRAFGQPSGRASTRLITSLLAIAIMLGVLSGCGGSRSRNPINQDTVDIVPNDAPTITYSSIVVGTGSVEICYLILDNQDDPVDITPEYSLDGGVTWLSATEVTGLPSDGVIDLSSSASGASHCFVWSSSTDGVGLIQPETVLFRLTPFDFKAAGPPAVSGPFVVFNPVLLVDVGSDSGLYGEIGLQVPLTLITGGSLPTHVSVTVQFDSSLLSISAAPFIDGPSAIAAGAIITFFNVSADTVRLDFDAPVPMTDGVLADLVFDSLPIAATASVATPITCISVAATDAASTTIGAACGVSGSIFLFPNLPPSCAVNAPLPGTQLTTLTGFLGDVQVGYSLTDVESDLVDVVVEYTMDGGASWSPATEVAGPPSEGTTALASSPAGVNHIFTWDADVDIPTLTTAASLVMVRFTPSDSATAVVGTTCTSGEFTVDLRNAPPTCVQPILVTGMSGDITITFDVDDLEGDLVDIAFEYESPPGAGYVAATASGISLLPSPALSVPTPGVGLVFLWDTNVDLGAVVAMANFRITVGDPFNPLIPPSPALLSCDSGGPFPIDNTACVFSSLRVLGPGTALGSAANMVSGGPIYDDPCTINDNYTFSLGGPNQGPLTAVASFGSGGNPLVFSDAGLTMQVAIEGDFLGVCAGLIDISQGTNPYGSTTYVVNAGAGGPYVMSAGNGMFQSLATVPNAQSGCDSVDVTFTPNGLGTTGGSNGTPATVTFAACVDYWGWDDASRNGSGFLAVGVFDANMIGTPSGPAAPGAGGTAHIGVYGKAAPGDIASAFDMDFAYDSALMVPDTSYATNGASTCVTMPGPWTITPNPMFMGMDIFLCNGFRITTVTGSSNLATLAFMHVSPGATGLQGLQKEWADDTAMRIPGPQPLPWLNPGMSSGFTLP